jgi:hypothetical protein
MVTRRCQHLSAPSSSFSVIPQCTGRRSISEIDNLDQHATLLTLAHLGVSATILSGRGVLEYKPDFTRSFLGRQAITDREKQVHIESAASRTFTSILLR